MAGKKGRSGRKYRDTLNLHGANRDLAQQIIHRYLNHVSTLSDAELSTDNKALQIALQLELKAQDIDSRRQVAQINTAPLLSLLQRAQELNNVIDVTRPATLDKRIAETIVSDTDDTA